MFLYIHDNRFLHETLVTLMVTLAHLSQCKKTDLANVLQSEGGEA